MWGRILRWPELGFLTTAGGWLVFKWQLLEGVLEWMTLVIGLLIGILTLIRLLVELGIIRLPRRRYRRRDRRRMPYREW